MKNVQIAHIAGVVDAIGTITVHVTPRKNYKVGYEFRPLVQIHRHHTEAVLIAKLEEYAEQLDVQPTIKEQDESYEFGIYGPKDIEQFIKPLLPHLINKYEPSVLMLEKIIPAMKENKHLNKDGFCELMGIVDKLRDVSQKGPKVKYTQDYFAEEFGI
jgi:hypothetical protein